MDATTTPRHTQGPWTYERLRAETPVDNVRRELIDGWLYIDGQLTDDPMAEVAAESAAVFHGDAVRELMAALLDYRVGREGQVYTAPLDVSFVSTAPRARGDSAAPRARGDSAAPRARGDPSGVVLQPDVFWLPRPAPRHQLPITVLPLLVIEVSSPSTRRHDLIRKRRVYEDAGVSEYWFVDTDAQRFECYHLEAGVYPTPALVPRGEVVASTALAGLTVAVDDILGPEDEPDTA